MKPIIKIENVGKRYRIGGREAPYGTLRESIVAAVRNPISRLGGSNGRPPDETIWALKNISLEVQPGEVLGVIGRNGAGKSTLLKILSQITEPTTGRIELYGRVGSLLEVGTGFHPELTGRENIYLNGAILGMRKSEIRSRFDEIVAFAELDKFIDTPVKRYSSGMYVRLAFAVAAHLEPDILLVDEVLAVGDAAFQEKCLGRIKQVSQRGRTVLFVSHDMTAINQLCPRTLLLAEGKLEKDGPTEQILAEYLNADRKRNGQRVWTDVNSAPGGPKIRLHAVRIITDGRVTSNVNIDQQVLVEIMFWNLSPGIRNLYTDIYLLDNMGRTVLSTPSTPAANLLPEEWYQKPRPAGLYRTSCVFPANFLNEGTYFISVFIATLGPAGIEMEAQQVLAFRVFDTGTMREAGGGQWHGVVRQRFAWRTELVAPLQPSDDSISESHLRNIIND